MQKYVVGFLFNDKGEVCLIEKERPEWQKGRVNGVGGHVEDGETPEQAMIREFGEETGAVVHWREFCRLYGPTYELYCFTARDNAEVKTMTDEMVAWYSVDHPPDNMVSNLKWLIPMANYEQDIYADIHHESETC